MDERHIGLDKKSRRAWLRQIARAGLVIPALGLPGLSELVTGSQLDAPPPLPSAGGSPFSKSDEDLLDQVEAASFKYFWAQAHPDTGMVMDRCDARNPVASEVGSIAATGFGLTALCIGEKRGYVFVLLQKIALSTRCVSYGRNCPTIGGSSITLPI